MNVSIFSARYEGMAAQVRVHDAAGGCPSFAALSLSGDREEVTFYFRDLDSVLSFAEGITAAAYRCRDGFPPSDRRLP